MHERIVGVARCEDFLGAAAAVSVGYVNLDGYCQTSEFMGPGFLILQGR